MADSNTTKTILLDVASDYRLSNDKKIAIAGLIDAAENVVIAFGMGWDMSGVIAKLKEATYGN